STWYFPLRRLRCPEKTDNSPHPTAPAPFIHNHKKTLPQKPNPLTNISYISPYNIYIYVLRNLEVRVVDAGRANISRYFSPCSNMSFSSHKWTFLNMIWVWNFLD